MCDPTVRPATGAKVAAPATSGTVSTVTPSMTRLAVPVGVPEVPVTVAEKVTGWPYTLGPADVAVVTAGTPTAVRTMSFPSPPT